MLEIYLTRKKQGVWLKLPSSPAETEKVYEALGGFNSVYSEISIGNAASSVYSLPEYLHGMAITEQTMKELQFLARQIERMTEQDQTMLGAMIDMEKPHSITEIVNLSCNLDKFEFYPDIETEEQLGEILIQRDYCQIPEELSAILDDKLTGQQYVESHAGCFTESGYVGRTGSGHRFCDNSGTVGRIEQSFLPEYSKPQPDMTIQ